MDEHTPDGGHEGNELLARLRAGDGAARAELFERFHDKLQGYFRRTLPNSSDVDDCVSDVIVRTLEGLDGDAQPESLDRWVWGIARNVLLERYRSGKRGELPVEEVPDTAQSDPGTESVMGKREALATVLAAITRLPAAQREVMSAYLSATLRELNEVKGSRLSALMGARWPAARVDRELHRAREAVKSGVGVLSVARTASHCPQALTLIGAGRPGPATWLSDAQWATLAKHAKSCQICGPTYTKAQQSANWALGPGLLELAREAHQQQALVADASALRSDVPAPGLVPSSPATPVAVPLAPAPVRKASLARTLGWALPVIVILAIVFALLQLPRAKDGDAAPPDAGPGVFAPGDPDQASPQANANPWPVDSATPGPAAVDGGGAPSVSAGPSNPQVQAPPPPKAAIPAGFASMGGALYSAPSVTAFLPGRIDVVARGANGDVITWYDDNGHRSGWGTIGRPQPGFFGAPAVVSWGDGRLDVVVSGNDNAVWHKSYSTGAWQNWESLGSPPGRRIISSPALASWGSGRLDLGVVTSDGFIAGRYFAGGWSAWGGIAGLNGAQSLAENSWGDNRIDIALLDADANIYHTYWNAGWLNTYSNQGGRTLSPRLDPAARPVIASTGTDHFWIFTLNSSGALMAKGYLNGWTSWSTSGGDLLYGVGAVEPRVAWTTGPSGQSLEVFVVGTDHQLYRKTWTGASNGG